MRNMCQQELHGWLIGAWDGKSQDQVVIQYMLLQFNPSFKLFSNSVKQGEGLTKAFMKNIIPGRRRKFGYELKDVVGPLKTTSWAQRDESSLEVFYKLASEVSPKWPSWAQRDEATLEIPRKLIYQCQRGGFASEFTLGPHPNLTRRLGMFFFSTQTTSY